jgi:hypothetical protein
MQMWLQAKFNPFPFVACLSSHPTHLFLYQSIKQAPIVLFTDFFYHRFMPCISPTAYLTLYPFLRVCFFFRKKKGLYKKQKKEVFTRSCLQLLTPPIAFPNPHVSRPVASEHGKPSSPSLAHPKMDQTSHLKTTPTIYHLLKHIATGVPALFSRRFWDLYLAKTFKLKKPGNQFTENDQDANVRLLATNSRNQR